MKDFDYEIKVLNEAIRMAKDEISRDPKSSWGRMMLNKLVSLEAEKIRITNEHNSKVRD